MPARVNPDVPGEPLLLRRTGKRLRALRRKRGLTMAQLGADKRGRVYFERQYIWKMETGGKPYPSGVGLATLDIVWSEYEMFASLIQNTGPLLTPQRMRDAAPDLGARGGGNTGHPLKAFLRGGGAWTQDVRIVYWDKNKVSPYNGKHGSYVQIEGSRYNLNFPPMSRQQQPPAPEPENRH